MAALLYITDLVSSEGDSNHLHWPHWPCLRHMAFVIRGVNGELSSSSASRHSHSCFLMNSSYSAEVKAVTDCIHGNIADSPLILRQNGKKTNIQVMTEICLNVRQRIERLNNVHKQHLRSCCETARRTAGTSDELLSGMDRGSGWNNWKRKRMSRTSTTECIRDTVVFWETLDASTYLRRCSFMVIIMNEVQGPISNAL